MKNRRTKQQHKPKKTIFILLILIMLLFVSKIVVGICQTSNIYSLPEFLQYDKQTASMEHGWNLILVNQQYRIPKNWDAEFAELSNGQSVDARIYPELQKMFDDARKQGFYPVVASGYRTAKKQKELIAEKIDSFMSQGYSHSKAKEEANKWVAAVGYSEHQTGLAVDINADGIKSAGKEVYDWLADNAWKYGFILRYPKNKIEITGTDYEPWHYRYVGLEAAKEIYEQGICLEEYIDFLK